MSHEIHQPYDKVFKEGMADIRVATQFFETHLPAELRKQLDLDTLAIQKESFIDARYENKEADLLYAVQTKKGELTYLYLLCENQSTVDYHMAFRLWVYMARIIELYLKQNPGVETFPVVYPMVIYTGHKPWDAPRMVFDLFGEQSELAKQIFLKPYDLIEVQKIPDEELQKHLWSGVVEFAMKYQDVKNFAKLWDTFLPWLNKIEIEKGENLTTILLNFALDGADAEDKTLFAQKSQQYLSPTLGGKMATLAQRFREEGRAEGIVKGEYNFLLCLLKQKFQSIPEKYLQKMAHANAETLLLWGKRVLNNNMLQEIFRE